MKQTIWSQREGRFSKTST